MSNVRLIRGDENPDITILALEVVDADRNLLRSQHLLEQILEVEEAGALVTSFTRARDARQAILTSLIDLLRGTGALHGVDTEDGAVVHAYLLAGEKR